MEMQLWLPQADKGGISMDREIRNQLNTVDLMPFQKELEYFEQRIRMRNLAESTIKNYVSCLKLFLAWFLLNCSGVSADQIDYNAFRPFIQFLIDSSLQPRSVNVYIATLKQFRYLVQGKHWNRYELQFLKYDSVLPKVPSIKHVLKLLDSSRNATEKLLLVLLFSTGIRISEACALSYRDICRDNNVIRIRPGKGRRERLVPLTDEVLCSLTSYFRETSQLCRSQNAPVPGKDSLIFRFSDGMSPANPNYLRRVFQRIVKQAGLEEQHYTPHSCRHFFALQVYLQKSDLIQVKELLGHHSLSATEVYLRLAASMGMIQRGYTNPLTLCLKRRES